MRFSLASAIVASSALTADAFKFPLGNGFPMPKTPQLEKIEFHAGGPLPNGALPTKMTDEGKVTFQLIALQEIFEVAYFTQLLKKLTDEEPGFKTDKQHYNKRVIRRIRAQEELHALGANGILESVGAKTVGGCEYKFPARNWDEALELAETFTAIVLAVVPAAQELFAEDGGQEIGLIPLVGSIIAQEGEQTGWFRASLGKAPSAAPFLTGGPAQFAYSALRTLIVPGSCPLYPKVDYFTPITVESVPKGAKSQTISYSVEASDISASKMRMAYLSGQSLPVTVPISNVKTKGKMTTFDANFPFGRGFAKGLTFGALVTGDKKLTSAADVAAATAYGPALVLLQ